MKANLKTIELPERYGISNDSLNNEYDFICLWWFRLLYKCLDCRSISYMLDESQMPVVQ